jgi:hypothetical protein
LIGTGLGNSKPDLTLIHSPTLLTPSGLRQLSDILPMNRPRNFAAWNLGGGKRVSLAGTEAGQGEEQGGQNARSSLR